jgi:hypothetical protein
MRWDNSAWALLQYIDFVREENQIVTGRGIKFVREKPSIFQKRRQTAVENPKLAIQDLDPKARKDIEIQIPRP